MKNWRRVVSFLFFLLPFFFFAKEGRGFICFAAWTAMGTKMLVMQNPKNHDEKYMDLEGRAYGTRVDRRQQQQESDEPRRIIGTIMTTAPGLSHVRCQCLKVFVCPNYGFDVPKRRYSADDGQRPFVPSKAGRKKSALGLTSA